MCSVTAVTIAATVASTAISMAGQYRQAQAQEESARVAAEYNAQIAANEEATQRQLAQNELAKGAADRDRQRRQAARAMGEMRANMGASGFQMDSGSMMSLLAESATEHQYDNNIIAQNANMAAWQHQVGVVSAQNERDYANWQKANAGSGKTGTLLGMGGTLLGGVATGIGQYNAWQNSNPTGKTKYYDRALQSWVSQPMRH